MDDLDELARARHSAPYQYFTPRPPPGDGWGIFHTIIAGLLVAVLVFGIAFVYFKEHPTAAPLDAQPAEAGEAAPEISLTAEELHDAYTENGVAADERYRGRLLRVSGAVESINRDIVDRPYVMLHTRRGMGVQCFFPQGRSSSISSLRRGDDVVIRGRGNGNLATMVFLKDCSL
jgi:hypothetical protein